MSRTEKAAKGLVTGYLQFLVVVPLQFLVAPLIIKVAGTETLGAYQVIMQVVGYLTLVELGLPDAIARFAARAFRAETVSEEFSDVLSSGRTLSLITNLGLALLLVAFAMFLPAMLRLDRPTGDSARIALYIFAGWVVLRTPLSAYQGGLVAAQELAFTNIVGLLGTIIRLATVLVLVAVGLGVSGLILANVFSEFTVGILCRKRLFRMFPVVRLTWTFRDKELLRQIVRYGAGAMLIGLAWRLTYNTDSIVVGYLFGASSVSVYYATQMSTTVGISIVNGLANSALPGIYQLHGMGDRVALRRTLVGLLRYTFALALLFAVGLLLFNRAFVGLWVGPGLYAGTAMTIALAIFLVFNTLHRVVMVFLLAEGKVGFLGKLNLAEGIVNLCLSVVLGRSFGLAGVMIATVVVHVPTVSWTACRVFRMLELQFGEILTDAVVPAVLPVVVAGLGAFGVSRFGSTSRWVALALPVCVFLLIAFVAGMTITLNSSERLRIARIVKTRLGIFHV
jgi:O-antigen/teichoic acid export membrane protein